jgi:predicted outer membrane repeat protein
VASEESTLTIDSSNFTMNKATNGGYARVRVFVCMCMCVCSCAYARMCAYACICVTIDASSFTINKASNRGYTHTYTHTLWQGPHTHAPWLGPHKHTHAHTHKHTHTHTHSALFLEARRSTSLGDCVFDDNSASAIGGAIHVSLAGTLVVERCKYHRNSAGNAGIENTR